MVTNNHHGGDDIGLRGSVFNAASRPVLELKNSAKSPKAQNEVALPTLTSEDKKVLHRMSAGETPVGKDLAVLKDLFSGLKNIGQMFLDNNDFMEIVHGQLTLPSCTKDFQNITTFIDRQVWQSGIEIKPGLCRRFPIKNNIINKFKIAGQDFKAKLIGYDLVAVSSESDGQSDQWMWALKSVYDIQAADKENSFQIVFDISPDGKLIYADTVFFMKPDTGVGLSFITPGEKDFLSHRDKVWFGRPDFERN